jgi:hypothetical protein
LNRPTKFQETLTKTAGTEKKSHFPEIKPSNFINFFKLRERGIWFLHMSAPLSYGLRTFQFYFLFSSYLKDVLFSEFLGDVCVPGEKVNDSSHDPAGRGLSGVNAGSEDDDLLLDVLVDGGRRDGEHVDVVAGEAAA